MGETGQATGLFFPQAAAEMQEAGPPALVPPVVELPNIGTWGDGQQAIGEGTAGGQLGSGPGNGGSNQAGVSGDEGGQGQQGTGSGDGLLINTGNPDAVINGVPVMPLGQPAPAVVSHATANGNNHPAMTVTITGGDPNHPNHPDNAAADIEEDTNMPLGKRIRARAYLALRLDRVAATVLRLRDKLVGQQAPNTSELSTLANASGALGVPE